MPRITKIEVRQQIYGAIAAWLRRECQVDTDDPAFHDLAMPMQEKIAEQFERKAEKVLRSHRNLAEKLGINLGS